MEIPNRELHRITSTAIIHKNGPLRPRLVSTQARSEASKYLIVRRSLHKKAFPGRWIVPGGGLEADDYIKTPRTTDDAWYFVLQNSLRREIKEEVNLEVGKLNYLLDLTFIRPDGIPVLTLSYWANFKSGKVKLNEENMDYKWVTLKEAKKYDLISGIWGEMEMVDKILQGKNPEKVKFKHSPFCHSRESGNLGQFLK